MLTAITRAVGSALNHCELVYLERRPIDVQKAADQHRRYEECLRALGARVVSLPAEPGLPDAVFVEDPAVVVDELAVVTRMGAASRRAEAAGLSAALQPFRPVRTLEAPATLEGGDVLRVERMLYVGVSARTNREGVRQLAAMVEPLGYAVRPVEVRGSMHLKTACCSLGDGVLLANRAWIDTAPFAEFRIVDVPPGEPWAANVIAIGRSVLAPESAPETRRMLERLGRHVQSLDISELMKAEAGLTCMSILFEATATRPPA